MFIKPWNKKTIEDHKTLLSQKYKLSSLTNSPNCERNVDKHKKLVSFNLTFTGFCYLKVH